MTNQFDFENDLNISQMDSEQKLDYLRAITSSRDPKSGKFLKGHSGNMKGRPPAARTLDECFNKVFAQKTTIILNAKAQDVTMLHAAVYKLMATALANDDVKMLLKILKVFGPRINLSGEMSPPKIKPLKEDKTVEMIRKAILHSLDKEFGVDTNDDNDLIE